MKRTEILNLAKESLQKYALETGNYISVKEAEIFIMAFELGVIKEKMFNRDSK